MQDTLKAFQDSASTVGEVTRTSKQNVERAISDMETKAAALHKEIDDTLARIKSSATKDVVPDIKVG